MGSLPIPHWLWSNKGGFNLCSCYLALSEKMWLNPTLTTVGIEDVSLGLVSSSPQLHNLCKTCFVYRFGIRRVDLLLMWWVLFCVNKNNKSSQKQIKCLENQTLRKQLDGREALVNNHHHSCIISTQSYKLHFFKRLHLLSLQELLVLHQMRWALELLCYWLCRIFTPPCKLKGLQTGIELYFWLKSADNLDHLCLGDLCILQPSRTL